MTRRLVLDTHTLIWMLTEPERMSAEAVDAVTDFQSELLVSSVVPFEIATKVRLGKFDAGAAVVEDFKSHLEDLRALPLNLTSDHSLLAGRLDWSHRDPFDRLLAAQALVEEATFVTADRAFADVPGLSLLWV